jgi:tRNA A-37 threonylcarbamoyl transferase component Bud32
MSPKYWSYFKAFQNFRWKYSANCYGLDLIGERVGLKLQFVEGISLLELNNYLQYQSQDLIVSIYFQIREALWELHDKSFVHGDISRANVIVNLDGEIQLIDHEPREEFQSIYSCTEWSSKDQTYDLLCYDNLIEHCLEEHYFFNPQVKAKLKSFCSKSHQEWKEYRRHLDPISKSLKNLELEHSLSSEKTIRTDLIVQNRVRQLSFLVLFLLTYIFIPNMTNSL